MPFFSKVFKGKDGSSSSKARKNTNQNGVVPVIPQKPRWEDAWLRKDVEPEEIQELLRGCTHELKSRALDMPFLLLPFRPASDPSAARTFIRNYFNRSIDRRGKLQGEDLSHELRLTEPLVLCSAMKWCWGRLAGGVVTWEAYELFRIGEQDSNMARDAFATFIPISVESDARTKIIFDFFDLMAAIAAHGKSNGMGGRKLSRLAGWWAFEHLDTANGFDGGYRSWESAADATSHLFFAYLRSLSPDSVRGTNGISALPLSLQNLVQSTEYPPERQTLMQTKTPKVAMIVDAVSPTPFALLRRAKHFEYRDDDRALQQFSGYDDPVQALTDECRRVLKSISSANDSSVSNSKNSTSLRDASWSRFEDVGFGGLGDDSDHEDEIDGSALGRKRQAPTGLRSAPRSKHDLGRPTTPSWADFLSSGFVDEPGNKGPAPLLLPPDKVLPPIRGHSSQSHKRMTGNELALEPGELASITSIDLDDTFWWVWITSLAGEEPTERKAVFGRCALIETNIRGGKWLIMEEMVKGAAPEPEVGAYIAEKKSRFGFSSKSRMSSWKKPSPLPKSEPFTRSNQSSPLSKTSIAPDQHARIQAAAAALQQKHQQQEFDATSARRARRDDTVSTKTNSVFTLQPVIMTEAAPAMKWANSYDKNAIRAAYLGNNFTARGFSTDQLSHSNSSHNNVASTNGSITPKPATNLPRNESYGFPSQVSVLPKEDPGQPKQTSGQDRQLPSLPQSSLTQSSLPQSSLPQWEGLLPMRKAEDNTPTSSPAPLPVAPPKDMQITNAATMEAAEVPLPSTTPMEYSTPMEYPRAMERKPLPPPKKVDDEIPEQVIREPSQESREFDEVPNGIGSSGSSPESKKSAGKKLKKKNAGGGFKGFFGRKKTDIPPKHAPTAPSDNRAAVAAARAALHGPGDVQQNQSHPNPLQQSPLRRRLSGVGRNNPPNTTPIVTPQVAPSSHDVDDEPPMSTADNTPLQSPHYGARPHQYRDSQDSINRVDTNEQRRAERNFRTFDQGPLQDQPAFVPEDSPVHASLHSPSRTSSEFNEEAQTSQQQQREQHHEQEHESEQLDNTSEQSVDLARQMSPVQDRWAQIRKNAAERAARPVEEQSGQTDKTDDGETSGEETIESRVARIKARVAELTGNMEGSSPSSGPNRR